MTTLASFTHPSQLQVSVARKTSQTFQQFVAVHWKVSDKYVRYSSRGKQVKVTLRDKSRRETVNDRDLCVCNPDTHSIVVQGHVQNKEAFLSGSQHIFRDMLRSRRQQPPFASRILYPVTLLSRNAMQDMTNFSLKKKRIPSPLCPICGCSGRRPRLQGCRR